MAIAFEVTIDNQTKVFAGIEGFSVLSLILSYKDVGIEEDKNANDTVLRIAGSLKCNKHDYWIKSSLELGEEILIRVVEASDLTEPISIVKRRS